jgi:Flp pilus assembly protein TadD
VRRTMADAEHPAGDAVLEALVARVAEMGEDERWEEAYALLLDAWDDHAEAPQYLCWLGISAQRTGLESEAYDHFRRSLALEPSDPFVLAACGSALSTLDDPAAEAALRTAALIAPDFAFARAAYGAYLAREGLLADAVTELEAARALAEDDPAVRSDLAIAYLLAGRATDGLAELEEALARADHDSWLRALYGMSLADAGRGEEGAEQLHRASLEREDDVEVQVVAALAAAAQGWEDEGWAALARAEAAAEALDRGVVEEAEERLELGPEAAEAFLRQELLPVVLRERLLQRG